MIVKIDSGQSIARQITKDGSDKNVSDVNYSLREIPLECLMNIDSDIAVLEARSHAE